MLANKKAARASSTSKKPSASKSPLVSKRNVASKRAANTDRTAAKPGAKPGAAEPRYWLLKSEPDVFSIDDLAAAKNQTTHWDGVRNYQARNTMRDDMQVGDLVLFYHSNAKPPGVAGIAEVVRAGYPDHTAWDPDDPHYDPKSNSDKPTWYMVDVRFEEKFNDVVGLPELKQNPTLAGMVLLQRGSRLSVQPVRPDEFETIVALGRAVTAAD